MQFFIFLFDDPTCDLPTKVFSHLCIINLKHNVIFFLFWAKKGLWFSIPVDGVQRIRGSKQALHRIIYPSEILSSISFSLKS